MVCSMVKKGVIGAALGAGALLLVFGTSAPSYVKTAFNKVRRDARASVPLPFDIERTRDQIASLEPAIRDNIEKLARAEVDLDQLDKEIVTIRTNLGAEKAAMLTLRESLKTGEYRLAGHGRVAYTEDEIKTDLARRFDSYNNVQKILEAKESTYKAKQSEIVAFRKQLETTVAERKKLSIKLDEIEARLSQIEAAKATNEFHFDRGALSNARQAVSDLEKRLDVMSRAAEMEGRYVETGVPVQVEPDDRDIAREIDAAFTPEKVEEAPAGKSL